MLVNIHSMVYKYKTHRCSLPIISHQTYAMCVLHELLGYDTIAWSVVRAIFPQSTPILKFLPET